MYFKEEHLGVWLAAAVGAGWKLFKVVAIAHFVLKFW